jgi:hypothetical protein
VNDIQKAVNEAVLILRECPEGSSEDDLNGAINEALEVLAKFETK